MRPKLTAWAANRKPRIVRTSRSNAACSATNQKRDQHFFCQYKALLAIRSGCCDLMPPVILCEVPQVQQTPSSKAKIVRTDDTHREQNSTNLSRHCAVSIHHSSSEIKTHCSTESEIDLAAIYSKQYACRVIGPDDVFCGTSDRRTFREWMHLLASLHRPRLPSNNRLN